MSSPKPSLPWFRSARPRTSPRTSPRTRSEPSTGRLLPFAAPAKGGAGRLPAQRRLRGGGEADFLREGVKNPCHDLATAISRPPLHPELDLDLAVVRHGGGTGGGPPA